MSRLWKFLCSLKLAIALASLATLAIMIGSLRIPGHPQLFSQLDTLVLGTWLLGPGTQSPLLSWWVYLSSAAIVLFGINTLCCFLDWLMNVRVRWRKTGEYLLHLGFCLVLVAYLWGSFSGSRAHHLALPLGATQPLPGASGYYLHLASFEPSIDESGRPLDFPQELQLLRGDTLLSSQNVRLNHPLLWDDMVIIPESFQQAAEGFEFLEPRLGRHDWRSGSRFEFGARAVLEVLAFLPHARMFPDGRVQSLSEQLINPAFLLRLVREGQPPWQGWYLLREGIPAELAEAGLNPRPLAPLSRPVSLLNVNYDPGAPLAACGGVLMAAGASLAMVSYYAKRRRGERPEVA